MDESQAVAADRTAGDTAPLSGLKFSKGHGTGNDFVLIADLNYKNGSSDLFTMDTNGKHLTKIVGDQPGVFFNDWGTSS